MALLDCNGCRRFFNPNNEGIVGQSMNFCRDCCNRMSDSVDSCTVCSVRVSQSPHTGEWNGYTDDAGKVHCYDCDPHKTVPNCPYCGDDTCAGWCA